MLALWNVLWAPTSPITVAAKHSNAGSVKYPMGLTSPTVPGKHSNDGSMKYVIGMTSPITMPAKDSNASSVKYFMNPDRAHNRASQP